METYVQNKQQATAAKELLESTTSNVNYGKNCKSTTSCESVQHIKQSNEEMTICCQMSSLTEDSSASPFVGCLCMVARVHVVQQVNDTMTVAILVVIPGHELDKVFIQ